jgi:chemotaxis protein MotB
MTRLVLIFAGFFSLVIVTAFLGYTTIEQKRGLHRSRQELAEARRSLQEVLNQVDHLRGELVEGEEQIEQLEQEKERAAAAQQSLEEEMRSALESKEITISQLQGKLTVNILDRILFDSGEAVLKPEGEQVLEKIAGILAQFSDRQVQVVGHTDNVPIRATARSRYASNWELSTARATAAVRFLSERAGVDPRRLGALGYGEFHPIDDNATAEGRARNRRIALLVLPPEVAILDHPDPEMTEAPLLSTSTNLVHLSEFQETEVEQEETPGVPAPAEPKPLATFRLDSEQQEPAEARSP